jgi:hypothetical protein
MSKRVKSEDGILLQLTLRVSLALARLNPMMPNKGGL